MGSPSAWGQEGGITGLANFDQQMGSWGHDQMANYLLYGNPNGPSSPASPSPAGPDVGVDTPGTINAMEMPGSTAGATGQMPGIMSPPPAAPSGGSFQPTPENEALAANGVAATPFGFGTPNPFNMMPSGYMGPPLGSGGWPNLTSAGTGTSPAPWQLQELQAMQQTAGRPGPGPQSQVAPSGGNSQTGIDQLFGGA